jgi:hypothetical protein
MYADHVRAQGICDLSVVRNVNNSNVPGYNEILSIEVLEDTDKVDEIKFASVFYVIISSRETSQITHP